MRFTASFLLVAVFGALFALGGCSSSDFNVASGDGGDDGGNGGDASFDGGSDGGGCVGTSCPCADPLFRCGSKCVDRSTDPDHCGACAERCPVPPGGTATCSKGICGIGCAPGTHACGSVCVSDGSPSSCGPSACTPCPSGTNASPTCSGGTCGLACHPGFADCDGGKTPGCETDITTGSNCGACGVTCTSPATCGKSDIGTYGCVTDCTPPKIVCGSSCVDVTSDPMHCGKCDVACASDSHGTATCGGLPTPKCGITCDTGYHFCGDHCVKDDEKDACGPSCKVCSDPGNATGFCDATTGSCKFTCKSGFDDCDKDPTNGCEVDLNNDPTHCGSCGDGCAAPVGGTATCSGGSCSFVCQPGWAPLHGIGCAVFGGVAEQNLGVTGGGGACPFCQQSDPLGVSTSCSCPSGFTAETFPLALAVSCGVSTTTATSPLTFCYVPAPPTLPPGGATPDYSGAFLVGTACSSGCEIANPYTGDCSCPTGSTLMSIDISYVPSCPPGDAVSGKLGICAGPGAAVTLFGAFANDGTGKCIAHVGAVTVAGSSCSCTGGSTVKYPVLIGGATGQLLICYP